MPTQCDNKTHCLDAKGGGREEGRGRREVVSQGRRGGEVGRGKEGMGRERKRRLGGWEMDR